MEQYTRQVVDILSKTLSEQSHVEDGVVVIEDYDLRIEPQVAEVKEGGTCSAVLYIQAHAPLLDAPFFDTATGIGGTVDEALQRAIANFMLSAMCGLRHFCTGAFAYELQSDFFGAQKRWQVADSCGFMMGTSGQVETEDFWELLRERLPGYLGGRRVYWVKAYAAKQADDSVIGELRINNEVVPALGQLLAESAEKWATGGKFLTKKQFFILVQDEATFTPYPWTLEQIADITRDAVLLFEQDKDDFFEGYVETLAERLNGDLNLAVELHALLPEQCAEFHFSDIDYSDQLTLVRGEEQIPVYKTQLTPYSWMRDALIQGFQDGTFQRDTWAELIARSSIYSVVEQVKEEHPDIELSGVRLSVLVNVPEGYRVR